MYNEFKFFEQTSNYEMMKYMSIAFATVMADSGSQSRVSSEANKLKPVHLLNYSEEKEENVIKEIEKMEDHFNIPK